VINGDAQTYKSKLAEMSSNVRTSWHAQTAGTNKGGKVNELLVQTSMCRAYNDGPQTTM